MTAVVVKLRDPYPPHGELVTTRAVEKSLTYGFVLDRENRASFKISRNDPNLAKFPQHFALGVMVSLERGDKMLPWVGFATQKNVSLSDPAATFTCQDHAGALFATARTAKDWQEQKGAAGDVIRRVFLDADARGEPPLMTSIDGVALGPSLVFTPKAESVLSFLRTMSRNTGWEWWLHHEVAKVAVRTQLRWAESRGFDRRNEVIFEEGVHFKEAKLTQNAEGYLSSALAVGGSGTFRDRTAAQVNVAGRADGGISAEAAGALVSKASSPALAGTRVLVEPTVTNREALSAAARRSYRDPDYVRERLTFELVESKIDMTKIELGSIYRARFTNLDLGLGYERVVRAVALGLSESGVMDMIAEVV